MRVAIGMRAVDGKKRGASGSIVDQMPLQQCLRDIFRSCLNMSLAQRGALLGLSHLVIASVGHT